MTLPRQRLIHPLITPYYHCVSRCVRRAFLCGEDPVTGENLEHRRDWIEARLHTLADVFAIDLCAYAVMSNHYHVVLHINLKQQVALTARDVTERWAKLFALPPAFEELHPDAQAQLIRRWRRRLSSISWFMRCVNEPMARLANREDGCKGRFWEGRFSSQALLDEPAVVKCMAYVDLNPVRAGIVPTPESSAHTSIKARLDNQPGRLAPLAGDNGNATAFCLPIASVDYRLLVDATGRQFREGKRGYIKPHIVSILARLEQPPESWFEELKHLTRRYHRAIGRKDSLSAFRDAIGQQRLRGLAAKTS